MELERGHIQKGDFPQTRKGYDPAAVDSHLRAIADAVERLKSAQPAQTSLAGTAASRVEAIVAAAEASAREIEERARADADETRARAERDAGEHVTRARQMVELLAGGAEQLQGEMDDVVVRVNGLKAALDAVRVDLMAAEGDVTPPSTSAPVPPPAAPEPDPEPAMASAPVPEEAADAAPEPAPETVQDAQPEPASAPAASAGEAPEGVRLIAFNMALSGTPRDETARYLRENFEFDGADALVDEVYAKVGS